MKNPLPPRDLGGETIGQRLADFRRERGYTQKELAEKAGMAQRHISDYETGRLHLNDEALARLATVLEVSSDSILGLSGADRKQTKPSLKILRRLSRIDSLSAPKQKALLKTLDMLLKASEG